MGRSTPRRHGEEGGIGVISQAWRSPCAWGAPEVAERTPRTPAPFFVASLVTLILGRGDLFKVTGFSMCLVLHLNRVTGHLVILWQDQIANRKLRRFEVLCPRREKRGKEEHQDISASWLAFSFPLLPITWLARPALSKGLLRSPGRVP